MAKERAERAPKTIASAIRRLNTLRPGRKYEAGIICHGQEETRERILMALQNAAEAAEITLVVTENTADVMREKDAVESDVTGAVGFIITANTMQEDVPDEGAAFAKDLRMDYGDAGTPILIMADETTEELQAVLNSGDADGVIPETFKNARNLIAAVVRAINRRYDTLKKMLDE